MQNKKSVCFVTAIAITLFVSLVCQAQPQAAMTRHTRDAVVNGTAKLLGQQPSSQTMRLEIVLPLRNEGELQSLLRDLYDPSSPSYRRFLTVDEFTNRFGPSQRDYDTAIAFAKAHGFQVASTSRNRLNLGVTGRVSNIERAFHVTIGRYQHPAENRTFYAPDREPTADLPFPLWHISGLDNYSIPHPMFKRRDFQAAPNATTGSGPGASFLGSDMCAAYYGGTALTGSGQTLGLLEYLGTDLDDLTAYYQSVGQTLSVPISLVSTDGTSTSCTEANSCDDTEQTIDITQAVGMAPGLAGLVMYVGSSDAALLNGMATANPLNLQLSSSWVWGPSDPATDEPYFQEFAMQGQSFFQAAGDWGEWSSTTLGEGLVYPSDDPYVISVGGTDLQTASAGGPWSSESTWDYTGGGISPDDLAIPSWQTAVAPRCGGCSTSYRNGPDVAAEANFDFYVCADQGQNPYLSGQECGGNDIGGTSFAAPMWAGYMALVNQESAANGGSPAGFINPAIYSIGMGPNYDSDFHDVTTGLNNGYIATVGYDLVTGWGSPHGSDLINDLAGLTTVSLSAFSFSFASTVEGETSVARALTLTNTGHLTLNIGTISASANFVVSSTTCGATLAVKQKCKVDVAFAPSNSGPLSGTLTIAGNALGNPLTVPLAGTGLLQATLAPADATYPLRKVGTTSPAKIFTLTNKQNISMTGISIATTGDFAVSTTTCSTTLGAKSKCTISVTFTPTQTGTRTGQLTVNDSANNSPQTVGLSGTGK